jgi:hypothetical membrane protein
MAIFGSPRFSWTENNISILGVEGSATTLFNSGLILTGALSIIFAIGLGKSLRPSRLRKLAMVSLILGSMAFSAIGIFPRPVDLPHDVASVLFFLLVYLAIFLIGVMAITASHKIWGSLSLAAVFMVIVFRLVPWPWNGGAIPQLLSILPWSLWTTAFGVMLLVKSGPVDV